MERSSKIGRTQASSLCFSSLARHCICVCAEAALGRHLNEWWFGCSEGHQALSPCGMPHIATKAATIANIRWNYGAKQWAKCRSVVEPALQCEASILQDICGASIVPRRATKVSVVQSPSLLVELNLCLLQCLHESISTLSNWSFARVCPSLELGLGLGVTTMQHTRQDLSDQPHWRSALSTTSTLRAQHKTVWLKNTSLWLPVERSKKSLPV